jgi:uncharacterized protein (DUF1697 family)
MIRYAAFLRAINVGNRRLEMDRLQSIFVDAGLRKVATLIASGNVSFQSAVKSADKLRTQIEQSLQDSLGFEVDTFLRTEQQLKSILNANPYQLDSAQDAMVHVHVFFFHQPVPMEIMEVFDRNQTSTDRVEVIGTEAYWRCVGRMTDSTYWKQPEIRKVKLPINTSRNIETVKRMHELVEVS